MKNTSSAAMAAASQLPKIISARAPAMPAAASAPSRPNSARAKRASTVRASRMKICRSLTLVASPSARGAGAGSASPAISFSIWPTPAAMPPWKSPCRKRGTMISSMMRFATASGIAPSRP